MPTYEFINKRTKKIVEHTMSVAEYEVFKVENKHLERYITAESMPGLGDGMRMSVPGVGQPDARFEREVIGRIKAKIPGNKLSEFHKTKMPRDW